MCLVIELCSPPVQALKLKTPFPQACLYPFTVESRPTAIASAVRYWLDQILPECINSLYGSIAL